MDAVESYMIPSDPSSHNSHHAVEGTSPVGSSAFQMTPEVEQLLEELDAIAREDAPRERLNLSGDIIRQIELVFSEDYGRELSAGCWEDSRLKILGVLGLCWSNCTCVDPRFDCIPFLGQISLREYEALHLPLQSSKVMRRLTLGYQYFPSIVEQCPELEDVAARPLGDIIRRMDNLEAFYGRCSGMSMAHWAEVAEAWTWRGVSNLTELRMRFYFDIGREGFNILASVLQVSSKLKRLYIWGVPMAEAAGKAWGEAVAVHQELEELGLSPEVEEWEDDGIQNSANTQVTEGSITGGPKECPLGRFIASAFLTDHPNQSVRSLTISTWIVKSGQVLRLEYSQSFSEPLPSYLASLFKSLAFIFWVAKVKICSKRYVPIALFEF
ncbi:hypothetical protein Mapa_016311 [Marchantia paleacea]|nr:hypothetical protein Mapa_016311 [Marchantia paleacea]